jgi:exonuclease SbcC
MLELHDIVLDGFLGYGDPTKIDLDDPGLTYISGPTGAGKSTIFEAILYLLTGTMLRERGSVSNLVNKVLGKGFDITLSYSVDGQRYTVREVRDRGNASGLFLASGSEDLTGKTAAETRKKILDTLGMSLNDFLSISFLGQNQTQTLIEGTSSQRAAEIVRIFDLDRYTQGIAKAAAESKEVTKHIKDLGVQQGNLSRDIEQWDSVIQARAPAPAPPEEEIAATQTKLDAVNERLDRLKERWAQCREILAAHKAQAEQEPRRQALDRTIERLSKELEAHEDSGEDVKAASARIEKYTATLGRIRQSLDQADAEREKIFALGKKCPINECPCPVGVPAQYAETRLQEVDSRIVVAEERVVKGRVAVQEARAAYDCAMARQRLSSELEAAEQHRASLQTGSVAGDPEKAEAELELCRTRLAEGQAAQTILTEKLAKLKVDVRMAKANESSLREARAARAKKAADLDNLTVDLRKESEEALYLGLAERVLHKAQLYQIDAVLDTVNAHLARNLDCISDGVYKAQIISQRKAASGKKMLDTVDILFADGFKELPIGLVSGGQKAQVGIALLFAIFEAVQQITRKAVSCLWLDEVFGPISADTLDRVFIALTDLVKRVGVPSVYVISHRDLPQVYFEHTWLISLENGISKVQFE